jgi:hypothetical protein
VLTVPFTKHIGMILIPGIHTGSEKVSKSPLLVNPGGPGGSGFLLGLSAGRALQYIVGALDQDVIGFDPRGILTTSPRTDCFSFPPQNYTSGSQGYDEEDYVQGSYHRFLWQQAGREVGLINSSSDALQKLDNRYRSVAKLCQTKDELYGGDSILKYAGTPNVARDMLSIVDAWDEWRATLDDGTVPAKIQEEEAHDNFDESHSPSLDTTGKLVFFGLSYGVSFLV